MAARAVRSFREQTYPNKTLLIYNTGESDEIECGCGPDCYHVMAMPLGRSIGALRNAAISFRSEYHAGSDIIIHWDDDDYSHPNRIAEQVANLQSSGADVVGYNEVLFWRTPHEQAWIYKNVRAGLSPGTSLCYWRKTWERKRFPDTSHAEDRLWMEGLHVAAMTTFGFESGKIEPRIIASIHGGNTEDYDLERIIARGGGTNWKRAPAWDDYCRERMAL